MIIIKKLFYVNFFLFSFFFSITSFALEHPKQAEAFSQKGQEALAEDRLKDALGFFVKAAELDTTNDEYFSFAALTSEASGDEKSALGFYKKARDRAVKNALKENAQAYNQSIDALLNTLPAWVEEKSTEASKLSEKQTADYETWQKLVEQAVQWYQEEKSTEAAEGLQKAVDFSIKNFGKNHLTTLSSMQQQAELQSATGDTKGAIATLEKAIKAATTTLGARHPDTLSLNADVASLQESLTHFDDAAKIWQTITEQYATHLGKAHPLRLEAELEHARIHYNKGSYDEARKQLSTLCQTAGETYGSPHPFLIKCLKQRVDIDLTEGKYATVEKTLKTVIDLQQQLNDERSADVLSSRAELANVYRLKGSFTEARAILDDVLDQAKGSWKEDDAMHFTALTHLAHLDEDQGKFTDAIKIIDKILDYQQKNLGEAHPNTLATMSELGGLYRRLGRFSESEKTFRFVLKGYESTLGKAHPATLNTYNNLGLTLENQGFYNESEPLMKTAYRGSMKHFGTSHPSTIAVMNNLALLHESQGVFKKAEPLYVESIEQLTKKFSKNHPDTLAVVNNLAYLNLLQNKFDIAAKGFEQVSEEWNKQLGERHQKTLKALNNLARSYQGLALNKKAEPLFQKVLKLRTEVFGERHLDTLRSMRDLGEFYRSIKKYDKARKLLEKAVKIDEEVLGTQHPYTFEALNSLADLEQAEGKLDQAFALRQKGFARRTKFLSTMLPVTGGNAREGYVRLHRPELNHYMGLLAKRQNEKTTQSSGKAALEVSLQRKGLLLKISSEQRQVTRLLGDAKLGDIAKKLKEKRKQLASLTLSGPTLETRDNHLTKINELEEKIGELEGEIGRSSLRFSHSVTEYSIKQLEKYLPNKAVLVDFWSYRDDDTSLKMIAGVVTKDAKGAVSYGIANYDNIDALQESIQKYREIIQDEDADEDETKEAGLELYTTLWAPLTKYMPVPEKNAEKRPLVYLVPDGMLNILPFNALVNDDEEYLITTLDLRILSSSRDILPAPAYPATKGTLIMAGPDYDSKEVTDKKTIQNLKGRRSAALSQGLRAASTGLRGLKFDPLPGAEKEGKLINSTMIDGKNKSTIFLKNDAQEGTLQNITQIPRILHVATHGFFLKPDDTLRKRLLKMQRGADINIPPPGDNPLLRAGLAFAGINSNAPFLGEIDTQNDGVLTALEVLDLNLGGTELAILSACETGLGEIHEGEGVYGLRRSFQEAGVKTVIASLWEVSDAGTQALMTKLYGYLLKGQKPRQALDSAQRDLMESDEWNYPYIWSAFMIVGK